MGGEFYEHLVDWIKFVRRKVPCTAVAVDAYEESTHEDGQSFLGSSAMVALGPVRKSQLCNRNGQEWPRLAEVLAPCGEITNDGSRGWPIISQFKQKPCKVELFDTVKLSTFLGARGSRRGPGKVQERNEKTKARAEHWSGAAWATEWKQRRCC